MTAPCQCLQPAGKRGDCPRYKDKLMNGNAFALCQTNADYRARWDAEERGEHLQKTGLVAVVIREVPRRPCVHLGPLLRQELYTSHCGQKRLHSIHACGREGIGPECSTALVNSLDIQQPRCLGCRGYEPLGIANPVAQ